MCSICVVRESTGLTLSTTLLSTLHPHAPGRSWLKINVQHHPKAGTTGRGALLGVDHRSRRRLPALPLLPGSGCSALQVGRDGSLPRAASLLRLVGGGLLPILPILLQPVLLPSSPSSMHWLKRQHIWQHQPPNDGVCVCVCARVCGCVRKS